MKQAAKLKPEKANGQTPKEQRMRVKRWITAALLVLAAVALIVLVQYLGLSVGTLLIGAASALLILEAVVLCVSLPVPRRVHILLGVLCAVLMLTGFMSHFFVNTEDGLMPRFAVTTHARVTKRYPFRFTRMVRLEELDMRASTITDFTPIREVKSLKKLDIRENYAFDQEEHDALAEALPKCDIRWSVPVHGMYFDSAAPAVDVTSLDLTVEELRALLEAYPEKRFNYCVPLMGNRYALDTEEINLQGVPMEVDAIHEAISLLPSLHSVDLRGTAATSVQVAALCDSHPNIEFAFTCQVPGGTITTEERELTVSGSFEDLMEYVAFFDYMPNLEQVDARGVVLTEDQADILSANANNRKLLYSMEIFGRRVTNVDTELNLDNVQVPSVDAMERCLEKMPNLKKVSMCDSGLSENEMGQLFDAHPDIKFIWWIEFGHYRLRTDATAFSTQLGTGNRYGYDNTTFAPLRYCTDLLMLDLGHNHINSLDTFKDLKQLRVLILADNKLTDISLLEDFKDLEYVELFLNDITDFSPLANKEKLVDLNVSFNPIYGNHEPFMSMPALKRLWIGGCRLTNAQLNDIHHAVPDCKINVEGHGSTSKGWRKHSHFYTLQMMYETGQYIPFDD